MKNFACTLALLSFVLLSANAEAQNMIDKNGRRQGHWIKTDKDGSKIYEGNFVDGHETGLFTYYYPGGAVRMRNTFTPDGTQCSHEAYDEKGNILATGTFKQKNRDGEWRFFNADGKLLKIANYRMGAKEGTHIIFNHDGDTAELSTWKDNRRDGRWWKRIGMKGHIEGKYVNGGLEGWLTEYDDDGNKVREGHYRNGSKDGAYRYYENQLLSIDETWDQGILTERKVMVKQPEVAYVSIFKMLCLVPQGKESVIVYLRNGEKVKTYEPYENLYARMGDETFTLANRENHVMIATDCVMGLKKDAEGRDILDTEPSLPIALYPDTDCLKMIQSLQREGLDK